VRAGHPRRVAIDSWPRRPYTGDRFLMAPGAEHDGLDVGSDSAQMLSTYLVEIDEPLAPFVDALPTS
jgi:hypothetical protein